MYVAKKRKTSSIIQSSTQSRTPESIIPKHHLTEMEENTILLVGMLNGAHVHLPEPKTNPRAPTECLAVV